MISRESARLAMRAIMAIFYLGAGALHLLAPEPFLLITPSWVPLPRAVIFMTGLWEIAGAVGLFVPRWRRAAGMMLAIYAVCVFPANIKHALDGIVVPGLPDSWLYHAPRLLAQPIIVWWALFCANLIDWPFGAPRRVR